MRNPSPVEFEMTKCNKCGSEMLMGLDTCPSCGKSQTRGRGSYQPGRTMLAVVLSLAVLLLFNWMKGPAPHASRINSPPSASLPSR